jgi:hypothetical protein
MANDFRPFGATMAKHSTASKTIEREDGTRQRGTAIDFHPEKTTWPFQQTLKHEKILKFN